MVEKKELICGIDDAGKGPVIGPMVLAGVLLSRTEEIKLKQLGVKDSKMLSPKRREALAKKIRKIAKAYHIVKISPKEIDSRASIGLNLNQLEAIKAADIINKLLKNKEKTKTDIIIDCPSVNRAAWKNYLLRYVNEKIKNAKFIIEHKADVHYPAVSAASIIAKVARDAEIEKIKKKIGVNFGSGYPADPLTQEFLTQEFLKHADKYKKLHIARETWQTLKSFKGKKEQKNLLEF